MATCGGLEHIFEKPLPENPTFLESFSPWKKHIKSVKPIDDSSFEIFGELHFKESHVRSSSYSSSSDKAEAEAGEASTANQEREKSSASAQREQYRHNESFSLCTEGLGFESFDDAEQDIYLCNKEWPDGNRDKGINLARNSHSEKEQEVVSRTSRRVFPPPISCIGRCGMPWACFKSYREDGRFILKEIRIPTQEFLHACRQDGRLKLRFVLNDDDILDDVEEGVKEQEEDRNQIEEGNGVAE